MEGVYEVAVVGAGVMGSWVAYTLAENGVRTVLLEQVPIMLKCVSYAILIITMYITS